VTGWVDPLAEPEGADPLYAALMVGDADPLDELHRLLARPAWHDQAACRGVGPDVFFPERGGDYDAARAFCARCPVIGECRDDVLATEGSHRHGVRADMTPAERRAATAPVRSSGTLSAPPDAEVA
jgi:hypothetical protein